MKRLPFFIAVCFVVTVLGVDSTDAIDANTLPSGATSILDVPYIQDGHERKKLDLYLPAGNTRCPLAVYVHGGGFSGE